MITQQLTWDQWSYAHSLAHSQQAPWLRDLLGLSGCPAGLEFELLQSAGDPTQTPVVHYTEPPPVYTSPDHGHTIYRDGRFYLEDSIARRRRQLGYLQQAITLADCDPEILDYLNTQIHEVLVYARLKGHDVQDWSETP